ncbi:MAG: hypothetical protein HS113_17720 [Verrucomicrobiales bacterium]|nr:hypothetical protein [Verrucomicrobiales bacterium]
MDGSIAGTDGECKGWIGRSYKGIWGYHPLVVSLASTRVLTWSAVRSVPATKMVSPGLTGPWRW